MKINVTIKDITIEIVTPDVSHTSTRQDEHRIARATAIEIIRELAKAGAINSTEATTQPDAEPAEIEPDPSSELVTCPRCQGSGRRTRESGIMVPCGLCYGLWNVTRKEAEAYLKMPE